MCFVLGLVGVWLMEILFLVTVITLVWWELNLMGSLFFVLNIIVIYFFEEVFFIIFCCLMKLNVFGLFFKWTGICFFFLLGDLSWDFLNFMMMFRFFMDLFVSVVNDKFEGFVLLLFFMCSLSRVLLSSVFESWRLRVMAFWLCGFFFFCIWGVCIFGYSFFFKG